MLSMVEAIFVIRSRREKMCRDGSIGSVSDGKSLNLNLSHVRACVRAQILVSTAVSCK